MGNDVKAFIPTLWSKRVQLLKRENQLFMRLETLRNRQHFVYGSEVVRPFMIDDLEINKYTRGEDGKEQTIKTAPEKLLIDNENEITVYIDDHDENNLNTALKTVYRKSF